MGCIPSRQSEEDSVLDSVGETNKTQQEEVQLMTMGTNDRSSHNKSSHNKKTRYTQSVKQLVQDGLILQPEFDSVTSQSKQGLGSAASILCQTPIHQQGGADRLPSLGSTPSGANEKSKPRNVVGFMRLSDEEKANRKRDMSVTFRTLSAFPDLGSLFSSQKVEVSELSWDFDCFASDKNNQEWQINATLTMFKSLGLLQKFDISTESLVRFLLTVKLNYNNNPFHNWLHAWSVMHASWLMISAPEVTGCLTDADKLAVMIAAVCHDLDHPGVNNDFLAKSNDPLSIRYKSPILERHHLSMTMEILNDKEKRASITQSFDTAQHTELCNMIEEAIMATDMGVHKDICDQLRERSERIAENANEGNSRPPFSIDSLDDRIFLVRSIVHTADLSGQAMSKEVAYKFGGGVLTEFHHQFCLEAERDLPLSGWMKDLDKPIGQAKSQLGFITFVVLPLWTSMGTITPSLKPQVERVRARMEEIDFDRLDEWEGFVEGLEPCKEKSTLEQGPETPSAQPGTEAQLKEGLSGHSRPVSGESTSRAATRKDEGPDSPSKGPQEKKGDEAGASDGSGTALEGRSSEATNGFASRTVSMAETEQTALPKREGVGNKSVASNSSDPPPPPAE